MTSLLGRLLPLFTGIRRVEDLFTEAVARIFERRPDACLKWLEELDATSAYGDDRQSYVRVSTQKSFVALDEHGSGSRPDLIVEVHQTVEDAELESSKDVVMIESKIGSWEGEDQLKRYAGHLNGMSGMRKTLIYITRAYDPKEKQEILAGTQSVKFCQLRWHDFYRFLRTVKKDALIEEVMLFMGEQGMARSYRFSTTDLMALSGVPRAFEIFDETLDGEVRVEAEAFAGNKMKRETADRGNITRLQRYLRMVPLHGDNLRCDIGYQMGADDGYPIAIVGLSMRPNALLREVSQAAMERVVSRRGWDGWGLDNPDAGSGIGRERSFAEVLQEEDHIAAIKRFFIESTRQLREELTEFKKEHPDLPWNGGEGS